MLSLKGKKVILTGGTAGIGREVALAFAKHGSDVALFGTNEERAKDTVALLETAKLTQNQVFTYRLVDVADCKSVTEAISSVVEYMGCCDILINNAGITKDTLLMKMSEEDWDSVMDTNLKSVYNTCRAVVRGMLKQRSGKIINISSVVALTGNAGQVNYASSKAGMIGFTKSLALELASRGICVNSIAPGFIQTRMTDVLTEAQKEAILKKIPMERLGVCEDIANAALFLGSSLSNYITGQVLTVDGGMVM